MKKISMTHYMHSNNVNFGTSGVRGLVSEMTDECCWLYGMAFIQHLKQYYGFQPGDTIAVAGDLRPSTPRIINATMKAIEDAGGIAINCGFIPSPAVAFYGMTHAIASIMVTGSHIPDDRNGIKFNTARGEILKADEQSIIQQVIQVPESLFTCEGSLIEQPSSQAVKNDAYELYLKRYTDWLPANCLSGKKIGLYEHSSVASKAIKHIFEALGADVTSLGYSQQFMPVDTEAVRSEDIELAQHWAEQFHFDTIISTDGDGDRPLISDENGEWLRGDVAGILTAMYLQAEAISTPINSNSAVEKCRLFKTIQRTRIGSPYVIEAMNALTDHNKTVVGYEANGGFLLATEVTIKDKSLAPLPTRDAVIVALSIVMLSLEQDKPISQLVKDLPNRYTYSNRLKRFPTEVSKQLIDSLQDGDEEVNKNAIHQRFPQLAAVQATNNLDGLRLILANDEIVHLRPSGNAPEFRCYTEASSMERAVILNDYCLGIIECYR